MILSKSGSTKRVIPKLTPLWEMGVGFRLLACFMPDLAIDARMEGVGEHTAATEEMEWQLCRKQWKSNC